MDTLPFRRFFTITSISGLPILEGTSFPTIVMQRLIITDSIPMAVNVFGNDRKEKLATRNRKGNIGMISRGPTVEPPSHP